MATFKKFWFMIVLALPLLMLPSCKGNDNGGEDPDVPGIDYTKFVIVNNGNGAVTTIDTNDKEPLEIVQTIPSLSGGMSSSPALKSATARSSRQLRSANADSPLRTINFSKVGTPAYITFTVTDVADEILSSILAVDNIVY